MHRDFKHAKSCDRCSAASLTVKQTAALLELWEREKHGSVVEEEDDPRVGPGDFADTV
jgi:hypothetical protein